MPNTNTVCPIDLQEHPYNITYSDGSGTQNWIFGYTQLSRKIKFKMQVEQDLSSFFAKFLSYLMLFQFGVHQRR